jgi:hypothetical protein
MAACRRSTAFAVNDQATMLSVAAAHRNNHHATTPAETTILPAVSDPERGENSDLVGAALSQAPAAWA